MPRIRSIKPEFPQSESMGRVTRDARLLLVNLFTIVDDEGRTRAASRMLASLLYPYDDDAPSLIEGWIGELERERCVRRYEIEGSTYLEIVNWLKHQKIDHPTKSRLPAFSDEFAKPRETSRNLAPDLGPRIRDQDQGTHPSADATGCVAREARSPPKPRVVKFTIPIGWQPSPETLATLKAKGYLNHEIAWQRDRFLAHFIDSGQRRPGWERSFHNWVTRDHPGRHAGEIARGYANGRSKGGRFTDGSITGAVAFLTREGADILDDE